MSGVDNAVASRGEAADSQALPPALPGGAVASRGEAADSQALPPALPGGMWNGESRQRYIQVEPGAN